MGEANSTTMSLIKPKPKERQQRRFVASVTALCFRRNKKNPPKQALPNTFKIWDAAKIQQVSVTYQEKLTVPTSTNQCFSLQSSSLINGFSVVGNYSV